MVTKFQFLLCLAGCGEINDVHFKLETMQNQARDNAGLTSTCETDDALFTVRYDSFYSRFIYTVQQV